MAAPEDSKTKRWVEAVNLLGSLASITGISLLLLKEKIPSAERIGYSLAVLFTCSFALGICAALFITIRDLHSDIPPKWRIPAYALGLPVVIFLAFMLVMAGYVLSFTFIPPLIQGLKDI